MSMSSEMLLSKALYYFNVYSVTKISKCKLDSAKKSSFLIYNIHYKFLGILEAFVKKRDLLNKNHFKSTTCTENCDRSSDNNFKIIFFDKIFRNTHQPPLSSFFQNLKPESRNSTAFPVSGSANHLKDNFYRNLAFTIRLPSERNRIPSISPGIMVW